MLQISLMLFVRNFVKPSVLFTPVEESILVEWVYLDCVISIKHKDTTYDLVELDMVEFDVILGMD